MRHDKHNNSKTNFTPRLAFYRTNRLFIVGFLVLSFILFVQAIRGWSADSVDSNEQLLHQYIQSKGSEIITFDSSNIKQFWTAPSVVSKRDSFDVLLNNISSRKESVQLKIQLANVRETQDCKVEIIANESDFGFSVLNSNSKVLSTSSSEENFLHYTIASSVFHMEDMPNYSFFLSIYSNSSNIVSIKTIILSFSNNKNSSFFASPGIIKITGNDITGGENKEINETDGSFSISGNRLMFSSKKKILISDKPVSNSVTVKNVGSTPTNVFLGYVPYTSSRQNIHNKNTPYKNNNQVLNVISSDLNNNKIIVDSYPDWEKGCSLVLNAKEDLSDFPNFNFVDGSIFDVKKINDDQTEILLDKPLKSEIKKGTKVRIQSKAGDTYLYTNIQRLNPGEEVTLSSTILKDDNSFQYSRKAFCHGTYYVVPILLSYSVDPKETNTIQISKFTVSF